MDLHVFRTNILIVIAQSDSMVRGFMLNSMGLAANERLEMGFEEISIEEIRTQLEDTDSVSEQADILYYLYITRYILLL